MTSLQTAFAKQAGFDVRFEWGEAALQHVAAEGDVIVVVDVFSFSTCVDIACARGASVLPFSSKDAHAAARFAHEQGALLASARGGAGFSLSPASLGTIPSQTRLVLPSPNGGALSAAARSRTVLAGSLRNAEAVARHAAAQGAAVTVVAAGERWPDGTLRPALEDLLGAGAIIERLPGRLSPEAAVARAAYRESRHGLAQLLARSASALELHARGFDADVALALEFDASRCVPALVDGAYVAVQ